MQGVLVQYRPAVLSRRRRQWSPALAQKRSLDGLPVVGSEATALIRAEMLAAELPTGVLQRRRRVRRTMSDRTSNSCLGERRRCW